MEKLEKDINEKLNKVKEMRKNEEKRDKIEIAIEELNALLKQYVKEI